MHCHRDGKYGGIVVICMVCAVQEKMWCVKCIPFIQKKKIKEMEIKPLPLKPAACLNIIIIMTITSSEHFWFCDCWLNEWWIFNLDSRRENRQGAVAGQGRLSLTQHGPCRQVHMVRQSPVHTFTHTYCAQLLWKLRTNPDLSAIFH